jgi:hypothetical protein
VSGGTLFGLGRLGRRCCAVVLVGLGRAALPQL